MVCLRCTLPAEHEIAGDVARRDGERARGGNEDVRVVLAHPLAVGQRLRRAGVHVGRARDVLDPVAHGTEQSVQLVERILAVHGLRQGTDGAVRLGLRRFPEEHARGRAVVQAGDHAIAVLRLDRATRLDHQLLVPPIDGEQMRGIAEAIPELQSRTGAARAHLPIEHPLAHEG